MYVARTNHIPVIPQGIVYIMNAYILIRSPPLFLFQLDHHPFLPTSIPPRPDAPHIALSRIPSTLQVPNVSKTLNHANTPLSPHPPIRVTPHPGCVLTLSRCRLRLGVFIRDHCVLSATRLFERGALVVAISRSLGVPFLLRRRRDIYRRSGCVAKVAPAACVLVRAIPTQKSVLDAILSS